MHGKVEVVCRENTNSEIFVLRTASEETVEIKSEASCLEYEKHRKEMVKERVKKQLGAKTA